MATRGSYVHKLYGEFFGGIPKMFLLCSLPKILMVSDNMRPFRTHTTLYTKPIREIFYFHYWLSEQPTTVSVDSFKDSDRKGNIWKSIDNLSRCKL